MADSSEKTASITGLPKMRGAAVIDGWRAWAARPGVGIVVLVLAGVIFAVDLMMPLGIAGGVPYVAPVLLTMWLPGRHYLLPTAVASSVLIVAGLLLSAPGAPSWAVLPNRGLALLAVWIVALLALERRRVEDALSTSETVTRAVLDTTAEGILTLDDHGRILSANPAAERIFACGAAELKKYSLADLVAPRDRARFEGDAPSSLRAAAAENPATREVAGRRVDGTTFPLELVLVPLELSTELAYTATLRDISERRLLERRLLQSHEEERKAVGHGLHEELGQTLTGLSLLSRQLARRLEEHHAAEAGEVADLASLLHDADMLALKLFNDLVPVDAHGGLVDAVRDMVEQAADEHGARFSFTGQDVMPLSDEVHASQLYRIVQDLIPEVLRRGDVSDIELEVVIDALSLHCRGTSMAEPDVLGEVMRPLAYRAKLIGARLEVEAPDPSELTVRCSL